MFIQILLQQGVLHGPKASLTVLLCSICETVHRFDKGTLASSTCIDPVPFFITVALH